MKVRIFIAALLLAAEASVAVLAGGCGKEAEESDLSVPTRYEIVQPVKPASLTFYYPGYPVRENPQSKEVLAELESKAGAALNISKLDFIQISWPNYRTQLLGATASGSPLDAFYVFDDFVQEIKNDRMMMDITEEFKLYAPGYYNRFSEGDLASAMINSRIMAVPSFHDPISIRRCAIVRDDLMEKYRISEIKTYDDLEAYFEAVKKNEPEIIPILAVGDTALGLFAESYGYVILDYELGLVYKWDDPDTKIMAWEQTPEYRDAIKRISRWKERDYFAPNMVFGNPDPNIAATDKFGAFIAQEGTAAGYNYALQAKGITDWKYIEFPLYPDMMSQRYYPLGFSIAIHKNSPSAEHVLKFIEWVHSSQENYDLMMYGIKDVHYTMRDEFPVLPENVQFNDSYWSWSGRWAFSDLAFERYDRDNEDRKRMLEHIESTTRYAPLQAFSIDTEPFKTTAGYRRLTFSMLEQSMSRKDFKDADIDEYIKGQVNAGRDQMLVYVQDQVDRWKQENGK